MMPLTPSLFFVAKKAGENRLPAMFRASLGLKPVALQVGKLGLREKVSNRGNLDLDRPGQTARSAGD